MTTFEEKKPSKILRFALIISHPIQHFCPQYVSWAKEKNIELKVFFASALGYKKYFDPIFGKKISWDNLNLEKFAHVFLNGEIVIPSDKNIDAVSLEEHLESFSPDLLIIYGCFQKLQLRAYRWATKSKVTIAYISDSELRHHHTKNRMASWLKTFYMKRYFSSINYFLTVGDANEEYYKYYGVNTQQFVRMHFPIDVCRYEEAYEKKFALRKKCRDLYNIPNDECVLSVVGKLASFKNQDHIIDALILLDKKGFKIHLFIIGSGIEMDKLQVKAKQLKHSKVHFTDFVEAHQLPMYYATTDIYIHPASFEPHSLAISEAIYMGCPIILSNRCGSYGTTDDVRENINGFVYPYGNIIQLYNKIKQLYVDDLMRKKFSVHSHEIGVKNQKIAHGEVLKKLIEKVNNK